MFYIIFIPIFSIFLLKALKETVHGLILIFLGLLLMGCSYLIDVLAWCVQAFRNLADFITHFREK